MDPSGSSARSFVVFGAELRPLDAAAVVTSFVLAVGWLPFGLDPHWTPLVVVLGLLGPLGLVHLAEDATSRDAAALWAAGFVVVALVAALFASDVRISLFGAHGRRQISWFLLAASFGLWAIGRRLHPPVRRLMIGAVVTGVSLSMVVGLVQATIGISSGPFAGGGSRVQGLARLPAYFGTITAAGAVLVAASAPRNRYGRWMAGVACVLLGVATNYSGTRVALAALIVGVIGLVVVRRDRVVTALGALAIAGIVFGQWFASVQGGLGFRASSGGAIDRAASGSTSSGRVHFWEYGLRAFLDRPVLGWGPGQFHVAIQGHKEPEIVGRFVFGEVTHEGDAHNLLVTVLSAFGILGVIALTGWIVHAVRSARGPLAWCALVIVVTWSLQPPVTQTLPLVMLMLGGAMPLMASERVARVGARSTRTAVIASSVVVVAVFSIVDLSLDRALRRGEPREAARLAQMLPGDPDVAGHVARAWIIASADEPNAVAEVERWSARRSAAEPSWSRSWSRGAWDLLGVGDTSSAEQYAREALRRERWDPRAWGALEVVARVDGGDVLADEVQGALCEMGRC